MKRFAIAAALTAALGSASVLPAHAQESLTLKKIKDSGSITLDSQFVDFIALLNFVHHILTAEHLTEHRMLAVKPRRCHMGDKKLTAVGARTGIGHGKHTGAGMLE